MIDPKLESEFKIIKQRIREGRPYWRILASFECSIAEMELDARRYRTLRTALGGGRWFRIREDARWQPLHCRLEVSIDKPVPGKGESPRWHRSLDEALDAVYREHSSSEETGVI